MILSETQRLIIRNFNPEDIPHYAKIVSDPDVMRFIGDGKPQSFNQAKDYIESNIENFNKTGWSRFAIELKETGELIGFCGYSIYNNELDFGWRYAKKHWRKGFGYEAAKAVLEIGLTNFKFKRIVCIFYPENVGSKRIIERLNFKFEKEINLFGKKVLQYVFEN